MTYIWQRSDWPKFTWQSEVVDRQVEAIALSSGRLLGKMSRLPWSSQVGVLADLMATEAVASSLIEGEKLDHEEVVSAIRNELGLNLEPVPIRDERAAGVAGVMGSVYQHYDEPLTQERLWEWQDQIIVGAFDRGRLAIGRWRAGPIQIVSGPIGYYKVHYEAPPPERVPAEMEHFLQWFNDSRGLPGPIRAGVAHLYFEVIHPFDDGNGRVGRALIDMVLSQELGHPAYVPVSSAIKRRQQSYYDQLNRACEGHLDITEWLTWFSDVVLEAQVEARDQMDHVLAKARFWDRYDESVNDRQRKVINRMLRAGLSGFAGGMSAKKYASITRCDADTAVRELSLLREMGAFILVDEGGRKPRYEVNLEQGDEADLVLVKPTP